MTRPSDVPEGLVDPKSYYQGYDAGKRDAAIPPAEADKGAEPVAYQIPLKTLEMIAEAITEHWGGRCPDVDLDCARCSIWAEFDRLAAPSSVLAEVENTDLATRALALDEALTNKTNLLRAAEASLASITAERDALRKMLTNIRLYFLDKGWEPTSLMVEDIDKALARIARADRAGDAS